MTQPNPIPGGTRPTASPTNRPEDPARYVQGQVIGSGGAGAVYTAWDQHLKRHVAIKRLPHGTNRTEVIRQEFLREVHQLAALSHPNILSIHDVCQDQAGLFMVTEYLPGKNLRDITLMEPLTESQCLNLAYQILCALASTHQRNIVHNDIKPENIIIWKDGAQRWQVKLLDFGCARPRGELPRDSEGHVLGSIFYVSPETIQGQQPDPRSDLYSFGLVLYFALTGQEPFCGETPLEIAKMRLEQDPAPINQFRNDLSSELIGWISLLTKRNHLHRPASAAEALQTLEQSISKKSWFNRVLSFGSK